MTDKFLPNREQFLLRYHTDSDENTLRDDENFGESREHSSLERSRPYSVSGFEFERNLIPLSTSLIDPNSVRLGSNEKSVGLLNGVALIVGSQIGSGIFSSPGVIVANTGSVGASLLVWLLSSFLGWTGASSFAELGAAIPLNGGPQAYLACAYGPLVSYLYAWTAIIALRPGNSCIPLILVSYFSALGGGAVVSLIFSEYLNRIFWISSHNEASLDDVPKWVIKLTAVMAIAIVTFICAATRKIGSRVTVFFTIVKVLALLLIMVLGLAQLLRGKISTTLQQELFANTSTSPSSWSLAMYSGLWAFDGWDQANYVSGDMIKPERNIPMAIHSSMLLVTTLFMVVNISYFLVLDKATVSMSNTVALDFGRTLFGATGGSIFAFLVAFSCFGNLNNSFFTSSRLITAAGQEGYLPVIFGRLHPTRKTPSNAALLLSTITTSFILIGDGFRSLMNFAVVASWAFYFLTVLGLIILRFKEPTLERPYKTRIFTPVIFCAVSLYLLCMPIIAAPMQAIAILGFVLAGIPFFFLTRRKGECEPPLIHWFARIKNYIRGYQHTEEGWEAVLTDNNEQIEMTASRYSSFSGYGINNGDSCNGSDSSLVN